MRALYCATMACGSVFLAPAAMAACKPELPQSSQTINLDAVEIGAGQEARETFQIRVQNSENGQCTATLRISRQTTSAPDPAFRYLLVSGGQTVDILPSEISAPTTASDLFVPGVSSGANGRAVPFNITLPTEWGIASGTRSEELLVTLLDESRNVVDTMLLYINIDIPPAVELRIVGVTGGSAIAEINLGRLDPERINFSDPFGVRIWSTSPYSVFFESENQSALVHENASSRIPYSLRMNGTPVDLTGTSPRTFSLSTGAMGDVHPLSIAVEPFVAQAGDYSDRVSVTVTAG